MAEYIKRDAALIICEKEYKERLRMCDYCGGTVAWNIGYRIKELPAADVAPVVKCKNCVFYKITGRCSKSGIYTEKDDFCSLGKLEEV